MSRRTLRALCFQLFIPRKSGIDYVVGVDHPPGKGDSPANGGKWCDVRAGARVTVGGKSWEVGLVTLADSDPPPVPGTKVRSGRHWLATGETDVIAAFRTSDQYPR